MSLCSWVFWSVAVIGALSCKNGQELVDKIPYILGLGIKMGAVMELIPRITALFIEGLKPISDATRELIAKKFKGAVGLNIGMSPRIGYRPSCNAGGFPAADSRNHTAGCHPAG